MKTSENQKSLKLPLLKLLCMSVDLLQNFLKLPVRKLVPDFHFLKKKTTVAPEIEPVAKLYKFTFWFVILSFVYLFSVFGIPEMVILKLDCIDVLASLSTDYPYLLL